MSIISAVSVNNAFARLESESSCADEMMLENVKRIVSDLLEISADTGASIHSLLESHFSHSSYALDLVQSLLESV